MLRKPVKKTRNSPSPSPSPYPPSSPASYPLRPHQYFGSKSLSPYQIKTFLSQEDLKKFERCLREKKLLDPALADKIANVVKEWAKKQNISHFCHWFQPMTGSTAEKHNSFLSLGADRKAFEEFSGTELIQSEPDASSLPSGGLRSTFEARGYTIWDPQSPMFMIEGLYGNTLYIPSLFISYHGEALDEKTPLLRSMEVLNRECVKTLRLLHPRNQSHVKSVHVTLGLEQEYFLVDRSLYHQRPDLLLTGRTLLGTAPAKGQQLEDHYFGSIPQRVMAFMQEVDYVLHCLGVPVKARHNEVAPAQFEIAPFFEDANVSIDHNHLIMEVLNRYAEKHHFALLLHEKPFKGINGNGKHNNWSLVTDTGVNLLNPGSKPAQNLSFLVLMAAILKGFYKYNALLRTSVASLGNDLRLGANEAPPAIMSAFLGHELSQLLQELRDFPAERDFTQWIQSQKTQGSGSRSLIDTGISQIPLIHQDNTDRNRTSPFAFTGNRFEFRAVGSSASCSFPITCLNTVVAESLKEINRQIEEGLSGGSGGSGESGREKKKGRQNIIYQIIRSILVESKDICFEGDNYSPQWEQEAERRKLSNLKSTPEALRQLKDKKVENLFAGQRVLSPVELQSRLSVEYSRYVKKAEIEFQTLKDLTHNRVLPGIYFYLSDIIEADERICQKTGRKSNPNISRLQKTLSQIEEQMEKTEQLHSKLPQDIDENQALYFSRHILPEMERWRCFCDQAETLMDHSYWPFPKYHEMLFYT